MEKRYEIFISSTFEDLIDERQIIKNIIVQQDNFPTGMEWFVGGRPPWHHIEKAIRSCDYYVLIMGGCYGAINPDSEPTGLSFTECEFRLAHKLKKEILPLVLSDRGVRNLPAGKYDTQRNKKEKLNAFRKNLKKNHTVIEWNSADELQNKISQKLSGWLRSNPVESGGWIRLRELRKEESHKQIFTYLFNRLNPYEDVSLTWKLIEQLDQKLDSMADVINVLEWLIKTYVEELIDAPIRVYFAYSLNDQHLGANWWESPKKSIDMPRYRLGISNSKDGQWQQGSIVTGPSNIHNVYQSNQILRIDDSTKRTSDGTKLNVPVGGEGSVIAAPVYALSPDIPIGVVGLNSENKLEAGKHRGLIRELSALFSSLFYAYCRQNEKSVDWNVAQVNYRRKPKFLESFRTMFRGEMTPQEKRTIKHKFMAYRLRNNTIEYFDSVLGTNSEVIE